MKSIIFTLFITNVLLCTSLPFQLNERNYEPLSGQGDITYYGEGGSDPAPTGPDGSSPGACALAPRKKDYFAALNYVQYGDYPNPNNSVVCGRCVKIVHGSNEVVVEIVDKCPICHSGDVDLSPTAFKDLFGSLDVGRVHNVQWHEVSCDELGKSKSSSSINNNIENKHIVSSNDNNWNMNTNEWNNENNNKNYSNDVTVKTLPRITTSTTKTLPITTTSSTKALPKTTTSKILPKTYSTVSKARKIPTPITITTSTVITAVFTVPITTVITDYNYYQATPTNISSEKVSNNNGSYQCYSN